MAATMTTSSALGGLRPRTSTGTRSVDSAAADAAAEAVHTVVEATARQARADSFAALQHHQQQAQRAAQHRARRLVSTARPGPRSTHARYDAAARLLREWYLTVHDTTLEHNLHGHPDHAGTIPDVADVETTAAHVARIRTGDDPQGPLRATALLWRIARTDADASTLATYKALRADVAARAHTLVARHDLETGLADQLSRAILRHWYQRCYLEAVDNHLGLLKPLQAVTQGEAHEVAASIRTRQARRIIGPDGVPLVTAHGTRTTDADRRLAAGETGVVPPPHPPAPPSQPNRVLREQVIQAWARSRAATRTAWTSGARVPQATSNARWADIPGDVQTRLITQWLHDHQDRFARPPAPTEPPLDYPPFNGARHHLHGPPEQTAARMFNHTPHPQHHQPL